VTDGAGHTSTATYNDQPLNPTSSANAKSAADASKGHLGCAQTAAPTWMVLLLALWFVRRQRRA